MGQSESKVTSKESVREVVKYVESDESKRIRLIGQLEKQLDELKSEVTSVEPSIKENVKSTVFQDQDALLLRYSQLTDKEMVVKHIKKVFGKFPLLDFLVETLSVLVSIMVSSEEMEEMLRWHEKTMVKRVHDRVYGIEAHYKVKILEETKGNTPGVKSKDTVVLIAYKCFSHVMDLQPEDFPDTKAYEQITF